MPVLRTPDPKASLALRLSLADPEALRALSGGEIRSPAGFDAQGLPVPGGLFCPELFGEAGEICGCGPAGALPGALCALCERPGARFAHVELACPVAHPWFLRILPSPIACLLGVPPRDLRRLLYGDGDVGAGEGERGLPPPAPTFAGEVLAERLRRVDLDARLEALRRAHVEARGGVERNRARRRLRAIEALRAGGAPADRMLLRVLPVSPPSQWPHEARRRRRLYATIIEANRRLIDELARGEGASLWGARRDLQRAVDRLFLHGAEPPRLAGTGSLTARLLGTHGALRVHQPPKRVAFSAASVVVPDSGLGPGECTLPIGLARGLYGSLVLARLVRDGEPAGDLGRGGASPAFDKALAAIVAERPLLVSGAQARTCSALRAFWPRLTGGVAFGLAPLALASLGLGGGERVQLHVPLSDEACDDLAERMVWPAGASRRGGGEPPLPTQQARAGLAFATLEPRPAKGGLRSPLDPAAWGPPGALTAARCGALAASALEEGSLRGFYASFDEVRRAYDAGDLALRAALVLREGGTSFLTSAGRCLVGEALSGLVAFEAINRELDARALKALLRECRGRGGDGEAALVVERLERLGLEIVTAAGLSLSADDLRPPAAKAGLLAGGRADVEQVQIMFDEGLITDGERYNKTVDLWANIADRVSDALLRQLDRQSTAADPPALWLLLRAGLATHSQAKHIAAARGLTAKGSGEIVELIVASSLHEGYSPHEYFLEARQARGDTLGRLKRAADADALLARLAACCADVVVEPGDCGSEGIELKSREPWYEPLEPLRAQASWGRLLAADLPASAGGVAPARAGEPFDEAAFRALVEAKATSVRVRSPLACRLARGVCAACYGRLAGIPELAPGGEAVGVLAAQSIGEAARRLVERTFHIGCGSGPYRQDNELVADTAGYVKLHGALPMPRSDGRLVVLGRAAGLSIVDDAGYEVDYEPLGQGSLLHVVDGQRVSRGERLADLEPFYNLMVAEADGVVRYDDLVEGVTIVESIDTVSGLARRGVVEPPGASLSPRVRVTDEADGSTKLGPGGEPAVHALPQGAELIALAGERVQIGDPLARVLMFVPRREDQTGGLPRLLEALDARPPGGAALLADRAGRVSIEALPSRERRVTVTPLVEGQAPSSFSVRSGCPIVVRPGERVRPGDQLTDGPIDPHDVLRIHGVGRLASDLTDSIRGLFDVSGELLDPRHIEVVVRQMLRFVRVDDAGDTRHLPGDLVDRWRFERENVALARRGGRPASARPVLVGIDRAAHLSATLLGRASLAGLARAALAGESTHLGGVHEALAVGALAPLGTGHRAQGELGERARGRR